jgi:hypothetical protein
MKNLYNRRGKLKAQPAATALAVWSAIVMLLLWILAKMGLYSSAVEMMAQWHMFFNMTFMGLIGGMIEAAAISFLGVHSFVFIYNLVASR